VETCAFIVIGLLGIKLCLALLVHYVPSTKWIESEDFDLVVSCLTLAVFVVPILFARIKKGKS
jgi:ABC-type phosphate transport system permease subunit